MRKGATIDDGAEWQAIVRGDQRAFERLVSELSPALSQLCFRMLGWRSDAAELDDVLQDVFVRVWAKRGHFRGDASIKTWVTSIALNVCRARLRRRQLWQRFLSFAKPTDSASPQHAAPDPWPVVVSAIDRLPPQLREVIVLHYLQEESVDCIAHLLGVRKNTIEVRLHRARKRLQEICTSQEPQSENSDANRAIHRPVKIV